MMTLYEEALAALLGVPLIDGENFRSSYDEWG
jgi:hypothetical protein